MYTDINTNLRLDPDPLVPATGRFVVEVPEPFLMFVPGSENVMFVRRQTLLHGETRI